MKKMPNLKEIKSLMQRIAKTNGIVEQVEETWDHETCVWKFAKKIADLAMENGYDVDLEFLKTGCYIHDIGRMKTGSKASKELERSIFHGLRGYEIVRKAGWPEKLARVCIRHMGGAGQSREVNKEIGMGNKDTLAKTIEERIIAYADCRAFFNEEKSCADIYSFRVAYNRFKIYPKAGELLLKNKKFIDKITDSKLD